MSTAKNRSLYQLTYRRPSQYDATKQRKERTRSASRTKKANDYGNYANILQPLVSHNITHPKHQLQRSSSTVQFDQPKLIDNTNRSHTALSKRTTSKLSHSNVSRPSSTRHRRNSTTQTNKHITSSNNNSNINTNNSNIDIDANKWLNILNKVFSKLDIATENKPMPQSNGIPPVQSSNNSLSNINDKINKIGTHAAGISSSSRSTAATTNETIEPNIQPTLRTLKSKLNRATVPLYTDTSTVTIHNKPSTDWRNKIYNDVQPNSTNDNPSDIYWWPNEQLSPDKPSKPFLEEQILLHKQTNPSIPKLHQKLYDEAMQQQQSQLSTNKQSNDIQCRPTLSVSSNVVQHDIIAPAVSIETQTDTPYALYQPNNTFIKQPKKITHSKSMNHIPSGSLAEVAFTQPRPYPRLSYSLAGVNKPVTMNDNNKLNINNNKTKRMSNVQSKVRQQLDSDKQQYQQKLVQRSADTNVVQLPSKLNTKSNISSVLDSLVNDPVLNVFINNGSKSQQHNQLHSHIQHNNNVSHHDEHKYVSTTRTAGVPSVIVEPSYSRTASIDDNQSSHTSTTHMSADDIINLHNDIFEHDI